MKNLRKEFLEEAKKILYLAGPAFFTSICQFSLGAVTQTFVGHIGTLELAAYSMQSNIIGGFSYGIMLGMGSALETLCGQAFGAGQEGMLGIYLQRSWVILNTTGVILTSLYVFAAPILKLLGQNSEISEAAGRFSLLMIPQLFAYAMNFPITKFLQAQSKVLVMAVIAAITLVLHTFFSWLVMIKFHWGLAGAAVVLNGSWWFIVVAQLAYVLSPKCKGAWIGFSWQAFANLWGFVKLSLASAVMICLEVWYYVALVMFVGHLKDAAESVGALSICINILAWAAMIALGFNVAVSVRVSNELGAAHPRAAKFSVMVAVLISFMIGLLLTTILLALRSQYPKVFTSSKEVQELVYKLTPMLAVSIIINNVQPVLSGVAIGAGWQGMVAYVSVGCYYLFGIPLGLILGYKLHMGVKGFWFGLMGGTSLQTLVLIYLMCKTNWKKEASIAEDRIRKWRGSEDENVIENNVES